MFKDFFVVLMKIGYPCINRSIGCTANHTFRLKSYSTERLVRTVEKNLQCVNNILEYNVEHKLLFFRLSSDLIPFASHPINQFDWLEHFKQEFRRIGRIIKQQGFRISMHPDQFTLLNSPKKEVVKRSIEELKYHSSLLDAMELGKDAKIQIHIGGVYGNKDTAIDRFILNYAQLPSGVQRRLVIENDERLFSLRDCLCIHDRVQNLPVLLDIFHHNCLNNRESVREAIEQAQTTWNSKDGILMVDFSHQALGERLGKHATTINLQLFEDFLDQVRGLDFDIMLEIKDKEASALTALKKLQDRGFIPKD